MSTNQAAGCCNNNSKAYKIGEFNNQLTADAFAENHGGYVKSVTFASRGNTKYFVFK